MICLQGHYMHYLFECGGSNPKVLPLCPRSPSAVRLTIFSPLFSKSVVCFNGLMLMCSWYITFRPVALIISPNNIRIHLIT